MDALPAYLIHHQAPDWCRSATESLLASTGVQIDLVVLNNGGDLAVPVPVWELGSNLGFAGAANVALTDFLRREVELGLIGAHDAHVHPETISRLVEVAQRRPSLGLVGPDLAEHGAELERDHEVVRYDWISGTLLLFRRGCVQDIGGFDPLYGSYVEDVDLCYRAQAAGWLVGAVPGAHARGLGSRDPLRAQAMTHANYVVLELKAEEYARAARRLAGLVRRARRDAVCRAALPLALRQVLRLARRGLPGTDSTARRPPGVPRRPGRVASEHDSPAPAEAGESHEL